MDAARPIATSRIQPCRDSWRRWRSSPALRAEARAAPGPVAVLPNAPFRPAAIALLAPEGTFPGRAAAFAFYHPDGTLDGRRVAFTAESRDAYRAAVARGGPIAKVLVPPTAGTALSRHP
jgi:hypothetical protein